MNTPNNIINLGNCKILHVFTEADPSRAIIRFCIMCYIALNTDEKLVDFLNKMNLTWSISASSARGHKEYSAITCHFGH